MKNFILTFAFVLVSSAVFANNEVVKKETSIQPTKVLKEQPIKVYCNGVYRGTISCDGCSTAQLINAASAMCD